jgi:hypothetical protein
VRTLAGATLLAAAALVLSACSVPPVIAVGADAAGAGSSGDWAELASAACSQPAPRNSADASKPLQYVIFIK